MQNVESTAESSAIARATAEPAAPQTVAGLLDSLREALAEQPEAIRKIVAELTADYLTTPDPETGQKVAKAIERLLGKP